MEDEVTTQQEARAREMYARKMFEQFPEEGEQQPYIYWDEGRAATYDYENFRRRVVEYSLLEADPQFRDIYEQAHLTLSKEMFIKEFLMEFRTTERQLLRDSTDNRINISISDATYRNLAESHWWKLDSAIVSKYGDLTRDDAMKYARTAVKTKLSLLEPKKDN